MCVFMRVFVHLCVCIHASVCMPVRLEVLSSSMLVGHFVVLFCFFDDGFFISFYPLVEDPYMQVSSWALGITMHIKTTLLMSRCS